MSGPGTPISCSQTGRGGVQRGRGGQLDQVVGVREGGRPERAVHSGDPVENPRVDGAQITQVDHVGREERVVRLVPGVVEHRVQREYVRRRLLHGESSRSCAQRGRTPRGWSSCPARGC